MPNFTKGRWVVCNDEKIYALFDDDSTVCIAELQGDNLSERHANGILFVYAPKICEALKRVLESVPILAGSSELDEFFEATFNAKQLLRRLEIESNVET